jgi:hypothetical protein
VTFASLKIRENNADGSVNNNNQTERTAKPKDCHYGKIEQTQGARLIVGRSQSAVTNVDRICEIRIRKRRKLRKWTF